MNKAYRHQVLGFKYEHSESHEGLEVVNFLVTPTDEDEEDEDESESE
jgi:hypothetical protein